MGVFMDELKSFEKQINKKSDDADAILKNVMEEVKIQMDAESLKL